MKGIILCDVYVFACMRILARTTFLLSDDKYA